MKRLRGQALTVVDAPRERCLALVAAVDGYPTWYPEVVKSVHVLARDGHGTPTRIRTMLHISRGPLVKDFDLTMAVTGDSGTVKLARIPHKPSDPEVFEATWRLADEGARTKIELQLEATLEVPRLVPLGGVGDSMADGFVKAVRRAVS